MLFKFLLLADVFFILSKILAFLITPLIWILGLLIYSFIQKDERRRRKIILISILLIYIFSNPFIFNECMRRWEVPPIKETELDTKYDAVIVPGGLSFYDNEVDRVQFGRGNDRLMQAIHLYKKGRASKIFFTGGSGSITFPEMKEAPNIRSFLIELGIPDEDILIESDSKNTRENALFSKPILEENFPGGKFVLSTSAFHMRRAMGCFEKVGISADAYSTDRYSGPSRYEPDFLFMPSHDIFFNWNNLIHEVVGYLIYKLAGYI